MSWNTRQDQFYTAINKNKDWIFLTSLLLSLNLYLTSLYLLLELNEDWKFDIWTLLLQFFIAFL